MSARRAAIAAALRLLVAGSAAAACAGCYFVQAAQGQIALNAGRRPIAAVLADPAAPESLRRQLALVVELRDYASATLGLPDNDSYRSYADIGRRYVVWNVFATAEFSVEPLTWCFPVAGCVAYRGYFREASARDFGLGLKSRGYDVLVAGVPAYSTLGHFADPVLNTMMTWDEAELAALLFHELAHQVAYAKGDSSFNEAFATTVEREGVRRWFAQRHDAAAYAAFETRLGRHARVAAVLGAGRARLASLYANASTIATADLRRAKREELDRLREQFAQASASGEVDSGYGWLFGWELGNASLLAMATYEDCVPALAAVLAEEQGDLPAFYAHVRRLAKLPRSARHLELQARATETCR